MAMKFGLSDGDDIAGGLLPAPHSSLPESPLDAEKVMPFAV